MDKNDEGGWVIDGNFTSLLYERRMEEADKILLLSFSRLTCLHRIIKRYRTWRGRTRPSSGEGCEEKLDLPFLKWVLFRYLSYIQPNFAKIDFYILFRCQIL
jgi:adenylate kinase family enzyme